MNRFGSFDCTPDQWVGEWVTFILYPSVYIYGLVKKGPISYCNNDQE
jgi:hypothetical protein